MLAETPDLDQSKEKKKKTILLTHGIHNTVAAPSWGYVMRGKCSVNIQSGLHHRRGTSNL